jgi:hypothetical protein
MRVIIVLALICLAASQEKISIVELEKETQSLRTFLERTVGEGEITLENCLEGSEFYITKKKVTPAALIKGEPVRFKAIGIMKSTQMVKRMDLDTRLNGASIFSDSKIKNEQVESGAKYMIDYEANVPTFTPSGNWEIFIYLINDKEEKLSCLRATFSTS